MRQTPATTTTTAIAALLCDDEMRTVTADGIEDLGTRDVTNISFENHEGSIAYNHAKRARCKGDKDRAVVELPSGTRVTNRTSIRKKKTKAKTKRFCTSCKHNLDAMTCFLKNRKTCTTCLTEKRELYEKRQRRFPTSTETTNTTSIREKRFCSSCKHNLDALTYFLENRKTCTTCLTKHKLYEERRRRQHKAND